MVIPNEHATELKTRGKTLHLIQGSVLVLLVVVSVIALWPIQREVTHRLEMLKREIVVGIEQATGRRITYDSISPSIFRFVEIRGLNVYDRGGAPVPLLHINRLEVSYNIFRLLTGNPLNALNEISIENSSLTINTESDRDLVRFLSDLASKGGSGAAAGASPFPRSIRLSGKNLTVAVTGPSGSVTVDRLFFQLQNTGQAYDVQLRCGIVAVPASRPFGIDHAETAVRINGTVDRALKWSDLRVRFDGFASNLLNIARPTFRVTLRDGVWQLRKVQDKAPFDLQASYNTGNQQLRMSFAADGFRPEYYFTFGRDLQRYSPWLTSLISGSGSVDYGIASGSLQYKADVTAKIDNVLVPFPITVHSSVSGDAATARFAALDVTTDRGSASFEGDVSLATLLPQGTMSLRRVETPLGRPLSANLQLLRSGKSLSVTSGVVLLGDTALYDLAFRVAPDGGNLDFQLGASFDPATPTRQLTADGVAMMKPTPYIQLSIRAAGVPAAEVYSLASGSDLPAVEKRLQGLRLSTQLFVATDLKQFSFASPEVSISDAGPVPQRRITLRVSGNNRSLDVSNLSVDWRTYHVQGSFSGTYVDANRIRFSSTALVNNQSYSLAGYYQVNDTLVATGSFGLDLAAVREGDHFIFTLHTDKLPIPFAKRTTLASLDLQGVYANPSSWELVSSNTTLANLPFLPEPDSLIHLSARITSRGGDIYSLAFSDPISKVSGSGRLNLDIAPGSPSGSGWLQLAGDKGEAYDADFSFKPGTIDAAVNITKSPLARLGPLPVSGTVSGRVTVIGNPTEPDIAVKLSLPDGQIYSDPLTASAAFTLTRERLDLTSLDARYLTSSISKTTGVVDLAAGKFSLTSEFRGEVGGDPVAAQIGIVGAGTPVQNRAQIASIASKEVDAVAHVTGITVANIPAKSWQVAIRKNSKEVDFSGGPAGAIDGRILSSGAFTVSLKDPLPLTGQAQGTLTGSQINASLENVVLDLHAFDSVVKIPYFDISRGKARGNLQITGAVNDPDFEGALSATSVYGRTLVVPDEIGPFDTNLVFQGKSMSMSDVSIAVGNSSVLGNLDFTIDHWLPSSFNLRFTTQSPQGVHVKYTVSDIEFDGYATGTAVIKGDALGTEVDGNLTISSCVITINNSSGVGTTAAQSGAGTNTVYNFTFTTGKQVQFVWPNRRLPIVRSYADTGQVLHITSDGNAGTYSIVGDINVRSGEVFYIRQNFYIREGKISFNEDQNKFDPIVNLKAELREVGSDGKPVSIYLIVDNKPLSQFAPSFESDPVMTNEQILTMLGQDIYSQLGGQQIDLNNAVALTGDLLGQFSIMRAFEDRVKQALNLDLFSVRTDLLQNIIQEKVLGQAPPPSATPGYSLGRYLDNTTLFLGKYFGNDLFLEAMISLTSNNAFLNEYGNYGNLQVDSNILLEWKTPLFLLQLSVQPTPAQFLSSLLNASLSLSWGFSF
ncbi:MAG TPA: translocation/assembly module TamB domain-containing protein [Spirochaetia bacterium]|nr:translocation/assembly module TamB domain-containing protein [Spirochaetia bacterium]